MANKPFDYTVINPLERPTSSDLNQAQGEAHADARALMRRMFYDGGGTGTGSMEGFFPRDFPVFPTSPASLSVDMYPGIGFQNGAAQLDIGGIAGLNDPYSYQVVTNTAIKTIPIASLPTSGNHRYDLIQVRALSGSERLTDSTTTDIYNPALNSFGGASRYKTLTTDINGQTVQVLPAATPATAPLSYKVGVEAPLAGPPPAPTADTGYLPVALILVTGTTTTIVAGDITDQRPLLKLPDAIVPSSLASFGDSGSVVWSNGTSLEVTAQGSTGQLLQSNGSGAPTWLSTVPALNGGTGFNSYTQGNLLYANSAVSLQKLAPGTTSQILRGGTAPSWGTVPSGAFATNSIPIGAVQAGFAATVVSGSLGISTTLWTGVASASGTFGRGNVQFAILPQDAGAIMTAYVTTAASGQATRVDLKYTITGPGGFTTKTYEQHAYFPVSTAAGQVTGSMIFPTLSFYTTVVGAYTVLVEAKLENGLDNFTITNYQLRAWQG